VRREEVAIISSAGSALGTAGVLAGGLLATVLALDPFAELFAAALGGALGAISALGLVLLVPREQAEEERSSLPAVDVAAVAEALDAIDGGDRSVPKFAPGAVPTALQTAVRKVAQRLQAIRASARDTKRVLDHVEGELSQATIREQSSAEVRGAFLTRMSHELRTPLNAILGYVEMIEEEVEDTELRSDLARVRSSALHLLAIVTTVLDLTQLESGAFAIVPEALDLVELARFVADSVQADADANGNELEVSVDPGLQVQLDRRMVRSILFNLASNACKYTSGGHVGIEIKGLGGALLIEVSDTGIGMTQRQIDAAFHSFEQGDASSTRQYDGAGLGLAVVRGFAAAMNGMVDIESTLGEGATVLVQLPKWVQPRAAGHVSCDDEPTILIR